MLLDAIKIHTLAMILLYCSAAFASRIPGEFTGHIDPPAQNKKNVILITISSLRADHCLINGYHRNTTPNFDKFASQNIFFTNAFASSSWSMPAMGSILTSKYPKKHGATHISEKLANDNITLTEILSRLGYRCVGFCCNSRLNAEAGFSQGFDLYDDYTPNIILQSLNPDDQTTTPDICTKRTNDIINNTAINWLNSNTEKPFFLFMHYFDNHLPYKPYPPYDKLYTGEYTSKIDFSQINREPLHSNPPPQKDIDYLIATYDGQLKQTDDDLGMFLKYLKDKQFTKNSIIIILADHGDQFYDHGHTSHHDIYEELLHIPLAISIPGHSKKKINALVSSLDIMPTILNLLNAEPPSQIQGSSLLPLIQNKTQKLHDYVFIEYSGKAIPDKFAFRTQDAKYIFTKTQQYIYNLKDDPSESHKIFPADFDQSTRKRVPIFKNYLRQNDYIK